MLARKDFFDDQWTQVRDRVSDAALFDRRGHHENVPQPLQLPLQSRQARGVNPIVVSQ